MLPSGSVQQALFRGRTVADVSKADVSEADVSEADVREVDVSEADVSEVEVDRDTRMATGMVGTRVRVCWGIWNVAAAAAQVWDTNLLDEGTVNYFLGCLVALSYT